MCCFSIPPISLCFYILMAYNYSNVNVISIFIQFLELPSERQTRFSILNISRAYIQVWSVFIQLLCSHKYEFNLQKQVKATKTVRPADPYELRYKYLAHHPPHVTGFAMGVVLCVWVLYGCVWVSLFARTDEGTLALLATQKHKLCRYLCELFPIVKSLYGVVRWFFMFHNKIFTNTLCRIYIS